MEPSLHGAVDSRTPQSQNNVCPSVQPIRQLSGPDTLPGFQPRPIALKKLPRPRALLSVERLQKRINPSSIGRSIAVDLSGQELERHPRLPAMSSPSLELVRSLFLPCAGHNATLPKEDGRHASAGICRSSCCRLYQNYLRRSSAQSTEPAR